MTLAISVDRGSGVGPVMRPLIPVEVDSFVGWEELLGREIAER